MPKEPKKPETKQIKLRMTKVPKWLKTQNFFNNVKQPNILKKSECQ